MRQASVRPAPIPFKIPFEHCPVQASLGILGRKWAFLVLRDIALFRAQRFNEMLRATPGLTRRTLSLRLNELEREGFIVRGERSHKYTRWEITEKGRDVLPVLMTLLQFGAKWHADQVFADRRSRRLNEIFDEAYIRRLLSPLKVHPPRADRLTSISAPPAFPRARASVGNLSEIAPPREVSSTS